MTLLKIFNGSNKGLHMTWGSSYLVFPGAKEQPHVTHWMDDPDFGPHDLGGPAPSLESNHPLNQSSQHQNMFFYIELDPARNPAQKKKKVLLAIEPEVLQESGGSDSDPQPVSEYKAIPH